MPNIFVSKGNPEVGADPHFAKVSLLLNFNGDGGAYTPLTGPFPTN